MTNISKNKEGNMAGSVVVALEKTNAYLQSAGKYGSRKKEKLVHVHNWLSECCEEVWGDSYSVKAIRKLSDKNEYVLYRRGAMRPRKVDVAVLDKEEQPVMVSFIKNVERNQGQNQNTLFDGEMTELAEAINQGVMGLQFNLIRTNGRYLYENGEYKRNKKGEPAVDGLSKRHLVPYYRATTIYESRTNTPFQNIIIPYQVETTGEVSLVAYDDIRDGKGFKKLFWDNDDFLAFEQWARRNTQEKAVMSAITQFKNMAEFKEQYEKVG